MRINWRIVLKWLLTLPVIGLSTLAAFIALEFSTLLDRPAITLASDLHVNVAPSLILLSVDLLLFFAAILLWVLPPAFVIGFALRARRLSSWQWGFSISLALLAVFIWYRGHSDLMIPCRWAVVCAVILLVTERLISARKLLHDRKKLFALQMIALLILFTPYLSTLFLAQKLSPELRRVWSVVPQKGTWQAMNTGSEFAATRQMIFTGDRIVVVFDSEMPSSQGKQPMSKYRVLSLDRATGAVKKQIEFAGRWGNMPYLFATSDGLLILENGTLELLNSDLTATGRVFNPARGRINDISPDGTTLAYQTDPGTILLDANSFKFLVSLSESVPTSVSRQAVLTNNTYSPKDYPKDHAFITRTDAQGSKLIFHSECGQAPRFLSAQRILSVGCGKISILDGNGKVIARRPNFGSGTVFAGVNQDGTRFALQGAEERGDSPFLIYERFFIYDANSAEPVGTVSVNDLPERQSWTAFSPDGRFFAVANPNKLSLYELP